MLLVAHCNNLHALGFLFRLCAAQQKSEDFASPNGRNIRELVAKMITGNPEIAASRLRIEQAEARLLQAGLRPNPRAEFQEKGFRIAGEGDHEQELTITQPIEIGGRSSSRMGAAQIDIERIRSEGEAFELQRITELETLAVSALSEVSHLQVLEGMSDLNDKLRSATLLRVTSGDASRYETTQAEAEQVRLTSERIRSASLPAISNSISAA